MFRNSSIVIPNLWQPNIATFLDNNNLLHINHILGSVEGESVLVTASHLFEGCFCVFFLLKGFSMATLKQTNVKCFKDSNQFAKAFLVLIRLLYQQCI